MTDVWQWLVYILTSGGMATTAVAVVNHLSKGFLQKQLDDQSTTLKARLAEDSSHRIEQFKAELQRQGTRQLETFRHELERQKVLAQLASSKMHEVYGRAYELLRKAEGAVLTLHGAGYGPDLASWGRPELESFFAKSHVTTPARTEIFEAYERDSDEGARMLAPLFRREEMARAIEAIIAAQNFVTLNSLYFSPEVDLLGAEVTDLLLAGRRHAGMVEAGGSFDEGHHSAWIEACAAAGKKLEALRIRMRSELFPPLPPPSEAQ
jgi:hypothetical protein